MDPQQPQQPQQPIAPPQPPMQGPDQNYAQPPQYQPQPAPAAPQPAGPAPYPAPEAPVAQIQNQPQPAPGQFGPAGPVPPQPGFPPQPQNGVFGSGPAAPYTPGPAKGKGKLFTLIGIIVAGLLVLGVGVWALMTFVFGSIALETYKGDGYSILVPKDYTKDESGSSVTFKEKTDDKTSQSEVSIAASSIDGASGTMSKDDYIKLYDQYMTEDAFKSSVNGLVSSSSKKEFRNFKKDDTKFKGNDAREISIDGYEDGKKVGSVKMLVVFTDKTIYTVMVGAHVNDSGLQRATDKILNSLQIES